MKAMNTSNTHNYTHFILAQMAAILILIALVCIWQQDVLYQIYFSNQVNKIGWVVNGGIFLMFMGGMIQLIRRFFGYRNQENCIYLIKKNISSRQEPLMGISMQSMMGERFLTLQDLSKKRANINQSALAATLLATESSSNSFLKFVHNVLILTGVFGTIISLSLSLLGASDLLANVSGETQQSSESIGIIIFGMSTALSTTLTAIIAYLVFGYFYIKLTDTQTFIISKIEEVTTTTVMPYFSMDKEVAVRDYSESVHQSIQMIEKLNLSQQNYADLAESLNTAIQEISLKIQQIPTSEENQRVIELFQQFVTEFGESTIYNKESLEGITDLLKRGFRISLENKGADV